MPKRWRLSPTGKAWLGLLLLLPVTWLIRENLVVVSTRSINHYLLWKSPTSPIRSGRLLLLPFDAFPIHSIGQNASDTQKQQWLAKIHGRLLVKRLGCMEPQRLSTTSDKHHTIYRCDSKVIAQTTGHSSQHFVFNGHLPLGQGFLIGDNPSSLDSRYLGLAELNQAQRVLTWWEFFFKWMR